MIILNRRKGQGAELLPLVLWGGQVPAPNQLLRWLLGAGTLGVLRFLSPFLMPPRAR